MAEPAVAPGGDGLGETEVYALARDKGCEALGCDDEVPGMAVAEPGVPLVEILLAVPVVGPMPEAVPAGLLPCVPLPVVVPELPVAEAAVFPTGAGPLGETGVAVAEFGDGTPGDASLDEGACVGVPAFAALPSEAPGSLGDELVDVGCSRDGVCGTDVVDVGSGSGGLVTHPSPASSATMTSN
jgi:hypothetical protein